LKRIKDFIYDHNDLVVALLIILVAASVIYGRMNVILDYPAKVSAMSEEAGKTATGKVDDPGTDVTPVDPNAGTADPNAGTDPGTDVDPNTGTDDPNGGGTTPGGDDPNGGETNPDPVTPTPEITYVNFTVADGQYKSWEQLAKGLQSAGILEDYWPLYKRVLDRVNIDGIESYTFYVGTYRIPKGADVDAIIDVLRVYPTGN